MQTIPQTRAHVARDNSAASALQITGIVLLCVVLSAVSIVWHRFDPTVARENGPMENFEAGCLLAGILVLAWLFRALTLLAERVFCAGLAVLFATLFVLEVDVRGSGLKPLVAIMNGGIRNLWLSLLWAAWLILFWRNASAVWAVFIQWLRMSSGKLMLCAGGFWLASGVVDKSWIAMHDVILEEMLEVPAAALMLVSVIARTFASRQWAPTVVADPILDRSRDADPTKDRERSATDVEA